MNVYAKQIISAAALLVFCSSTAYADKGKEVYDRICSKCHQLYIPSEKLVQNFMEGNNTLLKLKAPTIGQISYSMKHKIGDPDSDADMHRMEVSAFIADYIIYPDKSKSVLNPKIGRCFGTMPSLKGKLTTEEIEAISNFVYDYDQRVNEGNNTEAGKFDKILKQAKRENKAILVKAFAPHCRYCRKMDKVLAFQPIVQILHDSFIVIPVDISKKALPLGLRASMTPTFFFVFPDKKHEKVQIKRIPGAWSREDFLDILKEAKSIMKDNK